MGRQNVSKYLDEALTVSFLTDGPVLGAITAAIFVVGLICRIVTLLFR